jgi:hypothetical protein
MQNNTLTALFILFQPILASTNAKSDFFERRYCGTYPVCEVWIEDRKEVCRLQ